MQLSEWVRLLTNVPPEVQNAMILGVSNGATIAVQDVVRIDPEYVVLRGRLGGTTDSDRMFCMPYDQLTFFLFNKPLTDEQLSQAFGGEIKLRRDSLLEDQADRPPLEEEEPTTTEEKPAEPEPVNVEPAPKASA